MRAAPPVSVRAWGRQVHWRALQALLPALAVGAVVAWALGHAQLAQWPAAVPMAAAAALGWRVFDATALDLVWDGAQWTCDEQHSSLSLAIDLGGWMLLRVEPHGAAPRWIAIGAAEVADWHGMRVAVHAATPQPDGATVTVEALS